METNIPYSGETKEFPLFPGKYRIILAQPKVSSRAGAVLEGTITIEEFAWGFINVGEPSGFNAGKTDFRMRVNRESEVIMATPGDKSYPGYISGYQNYAEHYRGHVFTDVIWVDRLNIGQGYAKVQLLEEFELAKNLFNLKDYYDVNEYMEIFLPNNQTNNRIEYRTNGVWREAYTGKETSVQISTSRTNRSGKLRYRVEVDGVYVTIGESREFVVGGKNELDVSVNISANNTFYGTMDIVPPPYITHNLAPNKDSLVRLKAPHVNYGNSSSLTIGQSEVEREEFKSYMSYNLRSIPVDEDLDAANLVLSLATTYEPLHVQVYESSDDWVEAAVRWENRPEVGNLIFDGIVTPNRNRQLEIDLLGYIRDWYLNGGEQRSLTVVLVPDESRPNQIVYFSSKESSFPPVLKVSYYKIPPNAGVYYLNAEAVISVREQAELEANVEVNSQFMASDLPTDLWFYKKNENSMVDADVTVSIIEIMDLLADAEFPAKNRGTNMDVDAYVRGFSHLDLDTQVSLDRKDLMADLDVDLVISIQDQSELDVDFEIEIKYAMDDLDVDMTLRAFDTSTLNVDTGFDKKFHGNQIDASVEIRAYGDSELLSDVLFVATTGNIEVSAEAEFFNKEAFNMIDANMVLSVQWATELEVDVEVEVRRADAYAYLL